VLIHAVQLHDVNACVSYMISTTGISGPIFILGLHIFNTHRHNFLNARPVNEMYAFFPNSSHHRSIPVPPLVTVRKILCYPQCTITAGTRWQPILQLNILLLLLYYY